MTRGSATGRGVWTVGLLVLCVVLVHLHPAYAQSSRIERVLPYEQAEVEHALHEMHAGIESALPSLDGFIDEDPEQLKFFQQPRYLYVFEVIRLGRTQTRLRVAARITAWYADPDRSRAGNRQLRSTGRLENDLLDRLDERLKKTVWTLPSGTSPPPPGSNPSAKTPTLQEEVARFRPPLAEPRTDAPADLSGVTPASLRADLASVRTQRETAERQIEQLKAEIGQLEKLSGSAALPAGFVVVQAHHAAVRERPEENARILFQAEEQDQFESQETHGAWTRVRLYPGGEGWIKTKQLAAESLERTPVDLSASAKPLFATAREDTFPYSGEWKALQGKQAVFVVARPLAKIPEATLGSAQLAFVKQVFEEHHRQSTHLPQVYSGVVVIFLGKRGGVAASTLSTIRQWMEGTLSDTEFLKRCSLDPPEAFRDQRKP